MLEDDLNKNKYYLNFWNNKEFSEFDPFFGPISKINILIGANNSRKSRMIRKLFCLNEFHYLSEEEKQKIDNIEKEIDDLDDSFKNKFKSNVLFEINDIDKAFGTILYGGSPKYKFSDTEVFKYMFYISEKPGKTIKVSDLKQVISVLKNNLIKNEKRTPPSSISENEIVRLKREFGFSVIKDFRSELFNIRHDKKLEEYRNVYYLDRISEFNSKFKKIYDELMYFYDFKQDEHCIEFNEMAYIPSIRGMYQNLNFQEFHKNRYSSLLEHINSKDKNFYAGNLLKQQIHEDMSNKGIVAENSKKAFEEFISKIFFQGKRIYLSTPTNSNLKIAIDKEERTIENLGDGIQNLIILLYPVFMSRENSLILIDEPELSLHPGYQRLFMDAILNEKFIKEKNLTFFIATHSNHFLEFCERNPKEVSAFRFRYMSPEKSLIEPRNSPVSVLDDIGVCNNSVCMANCSIWVEGPTDVTYIRTFLNIFSKTMDRKFIEGLDYCFFEYGGNLIANYIKQPEEEDNDVESKKASLDMLRNANRILLIADNDNVDFENKPKKKERFQKLREIENENEAKSIENENEANFKFMDTKYVEIENLLPQSCILSYYKKQMKFNEKIEFPELNIENVRLGKIYNELKIKYRKDSKTNFANKNGSLKIYYKGKLSKHVSEYYRENPDITWKKITDEIKKDNPSHPLIEFVESIYHFIEQNNEIK